MPALARAPPTPEGHSVELSVAGEDRLVEQGVVGKVAQPNSASLLKAAPPNRAPPVKVVLSN
jgi:hypothetical protein